MEFSVAGSVFCLKRMSTKLLKVLKKKEYDALWFVNHLLDSYSNDIWKRHFLQKDMLWDTRFMMLFVRFAKAIENSDSQ